MTLRHYILTLIGTGLLLGWSAAAEDKTPEAKLTFTAKNGNVTFDHAAHMKHEKNDCKVCHDKLFQKSAAEPLKFKTSMHKPAEKAKTSCGFCHREGGAAFESKGNCAKCHEAHKA
jgi:c(7)-type cytochrome triheme protein